MSVTNTDAVLWYNVGEFGDLGYAVPNWSNDEDSNNATILELVDLIGANLFTIMHHEDTRMLGPPSLNTCERVHRLYLRLRQIIAVRAVDTDEKNMEAKHVSPAGGTFLVYPVPYFHVQNVFLKRWCGLILMMLSEAMQHTENTKGIEISTRFGAQVGQFFKRVYNNMAAELYGKSREEVLPLGFQLSDEELYNYHPWEFMTDREATAVVPRHAQIFTEDRLEGLAAGIPVSNLPDSLGPWPTNTIAKSQQQRPIGDAAGTGGGNSSAMPAVQP